MSKYRTLHVGQQVAYFPLHTHGDPKHPDVEFGFVAGPPRGGAYPVRYWRRDLAELRTKANSEITSGAFLWRWVSVDQWRVTDELKKIERANSEQTTST